MCRDKSDASRIVTSVTRHTAHPGHGLITHRNGNTLGSILTTRISEIMNNTPLTEVLDDEVALLVVHHLGVLVRDALAPADGVAAHQDLVGARGLPHDRDRVITRLSLSFALFQIL